jgi:hypothetical protein
MKKWSMALVLAAAVPDAALAKEPEVLARTGKWVVDYDADACHLYAEFGAGDAGARVSWISASRRRRFS